MVLKNSSTFLGTKTWTNVNGQGTQVSSKAINASEYFWEKSLELLLSKVTVDFKLQCMTMKPFMISSNKMIKEKIKSRGKINLGQPKTLQVPPPKLVSQYSSSEYLQRGEVLAILKISEIQWGQLRLSMFPLRNSTNSSNKIGIWRNKCR